MEELVRMSFMLLERKGIQMKKVSEVERAVCEGKERFGSAERAWRAVEGFGARRVRRGKGLKMGVYKCRVREGGEHWHLTGGERK